MAGVESMIVEEKQPPTKQVDREKVILILSLIVRKKCVFRMRFSA